MTVAALLLVLGISRASAADPLTFDVQPPLSESRLMMTERIAWALANDGPAPEHADDATVALTTMVALRLHPRLTVFGTLGYVRRYAELSAPAGGRVHRSSAGLTDVGLSAGLVAYRSALAGGRLTLSTIAGIKLPTGHDDDMDRFGRLPQRLQVGTGAVDVLGALLASWRRAPWAGDIALSYLTRGTANDFHAGDELRVDVSARRCIVACAPRSDSLDAVAEMRMVHQAADTGRLAPAESGGVRWYLAPGLRWRAGRHVVELALELPLLQPYDRHIDFVIRSGYRFLVD